MEKSNSTEGRVRLVARTARNNIKNVSHRPKSLAAKDVMAAFGGRPLGIKAGNTSDPITLLAIRTILADRLHSTGGRPSLSGENSRQRVQISAEDWSKIRKIADTVEVKHHRVSPAQVASVLIHFALKRASFDEIGSLVKVDTKSSKKARTEQQRVAAQG